MTHHNTWARVAELAYALDLESSSRKALGVRIPSLAPEIYRSHIAWTIELSRPPDKEVSGGYTFMEGGAKRFDLFAPYANILRFAARGKQEETLSRIRENLPGK